MNTKMFKKISAIIITSFFMMLFASSALAACSKGNYSDPKSIWPLMQCGYGDCHDCDFKEAIILLNRILKWFIGIAGVVATITFTIAGFKILLNPSNPAKITEGKDMFYKTVWGMLIVLGAWLAVTTTVSFFVKSGSSTDPLMFLKN